MRSQKDESQFLAAQAGAQDQIGGRAQIERVDRFGSRTRLGGERAPQTVAGVGGLQVSDDRGWLVIFDRHAGWPPIAERTDSREVRSPRGRTIQVVRA